MNDGKRSEKPLSQDELRMMKRLRRHPEAQDRVEQAAWVALSSVLLNLDEFITRE